MSIITIPELMKEFHLEIDDVRWYLSLQFARKFQEYQKNLEELGHYIWSKNLETDLYDMEEKYLADLQSRIEEETIDESTLRQIFTEILIDKENRYG